MGQKWELLPSFHLPLLDQLVKSPAWVLLPAPPLVNLTSLHCWAEVGASPFLPSSLDQLPFPSGAATAPGEQNPCLIPLPSPNHRVPLIRKKSLRRTLSERGLLKDFLKKHNLNPASKYFPQWEAPTLVDEQPLENYLDVSVRASGGASSEDLASRKEGVPGVLEDGPGLCGSRQ